MTFAQIPVNWKTKQPIISEWREYQSRLPTAEETARWTEELQPLAWASILGHVSGDVFVVDVDSLGAELTVIGRWMKFLGPTMTVATSGYVFDEPTSGKRHFYFKDTSGVRLKKKVYKFEQITSDPRVAHVDVQGEGAYVLTPGSKHPSGTIYTVIDESPIKEISYARVVEVLRIIKQHWLLIEAVLPFYRVHSRHDVSLALAGFCYHHDFTLEEALILGRTLGYAALDPLSSESDIQKVEQNFRVTWERGESGIPVGYKAADEGDIGWPEELVEAVEKLAPRVLFSRSKARQEISGLSFSVQEEDDAESWEKQKAAPKEQKPIEPETEDGKKPKKESGGKKKPDAFTEIIGLLTEKFKVGGEDMVRRTQHGEPFVGYEDQKGLHLLMVNTKEFYDWVTLIAFEELTVVVYSETLSRLRGYFSAMSQRYPKVSLEPRIVLSEDRKTLYYDLCNEDNEMVVVNAKGWHTEYVKSPMFIRRPHMIPQQRPALVHDPVAEVSRLLPFVRFRPEDEAVALSHIAAFFIPNIPRYIMDHYGPAGTVKSSRAKAIRTLIDPSSVLLQRPSDDEKEMIQSLDHHYLPIFDNISFIDDAISDLLCRAVTGEGATARSLYTNDDEFNRAYKRAVQITGINAVYGKPDLSDRVMSYETIESPVYISELQLDKDLKEVVPLILGGMFSIISRAMANYEAVNSELAGKLTRMSDFCIWLESSGRALGYPPMTVFDTYLQKLAERSHDVLVSSSVGNALFEFMKVQKVWEGPMGALLGQLRLKASMLNHEVGNDKNWPKDPTRLSSKLNELRPNIIKSGIKFEIIDKTNRVYRFVLQKTLASGSASGKSYGETDAADAADAVSRFDGKIEKKPISSVGLEARDEIASSASSASVSSIEPKIPLASEQRQASVSSASADAGKSEAEEELASIDGQIAREDAIRKFKFKLVLNKKDE